ncbi:nitrate/TMAO reductase-like tetraheme cytochrome c subunit [Roseimarinus sediminis]|jgi:nitrate/TMAO reductase-like tetraheme cytochrome c subunit
MFLRKQKYCIFSSENVRSKSIELEAAVIKNRKTCDNCHREDSKELKTIFIRATKVKPMKANSTSSCKLIGSESPR